MACGNKSQRKTVFCIMEQPDKARLLNKINSIEKALMILMVFREGQPSWGVRELSAHLGFSPSTIQRILQILKTYGFIRQDPNTRLYSLGNIYLSFFRALQDNYPITRIAMPVGNRAPLYAGVASICYSGNSS